MAYQIYFDELKGWTFNRYWEVLTSSIESLGVCHNERFTDHPVMRNDCAGILVAENLLILPGNCITDHYCKNALHYFMFNYAMTDSNPVKMKRDRKDFYQCKKVLKRIWSPETGTSFAHIELDKKVQNIKPITVTSKNHIRETDELIAIGYPHGMPMKISSGAFVTDQN